MASLTLAVVLFLTLVSSIKNQLAGRLVKAKGRIMTAVLAAVVFHHTVKIVHHAVRNGVRTYRQLTQVKISQWERHLCVGLSHGAACKTEPLQMENDDRREVPEVQLLAGVLPPPTLGAGPVCDEVAANKLVQTVVQTAKTHRRRRQRAAIAARTSPRWPTRNSQAVHISVDFCRP